MMQNAKKGGGCRPRRTNTGWLAIGYLLAMVVTAMLMYAGMHYINTTDNENIDIALHHMIERYSGLSTGHNQVVTDAPESTIY